MTLMTFEEEEILHRVRRLEEKVTLLEVICLEILENVKRPTYAAPAGFAFAPGAVPLTPP
jgi:hypothetical protein